MPVLNGARARRLRSSLHSRNVCPPRSSMATRQRGSGRPPASEPNSKSTAQTSRKGRSSTAEDLLDERVIVVADHAVRERKLHHLLHRIGWPYGLRDRQAAGG